jgi:hypothetical protein
MAIYGGFEDQRPLGDFALLDVNEMLWTVPMVGGYWPSPRFSSGMSWGLSEEGRGMLVVLGGTDRNLCKMDLFSLEETPLDPSQSWIVTKPSDPPRVSNAQIRLTITEQSHRIAKLESRLKTYCDSIEELKEERQQLEGQKEQDSHLTQDEQGGLDRRQRRLNKQITLKTERLEVSQELLVLHRQKEALMAQRVSDLEDLVKRAEALQITLDNSYHEVISINQNFGFKSLPREKLLALESIKSVHKQELASTRDHYKETVAEQQALDGQLAALPL